MFSKVVDLNENQLEGTIPKSLVNCQKLQVLNLRSNFLIERFPCFLSKISKFRICWKGGGYRKYLREMEEDKIFERRLVSYYLRNVFVLASLGLFWIHIKMMMSPPFIGLKGEF